MLDRYPKAISTKERYGTVKILLKNFRLGDENLKTGWFTAATHVVDILDEISPEWDVTTRGNDDIDHQDCFVGSHRGACELLRFHPRVGAAAAMQMDYKFAVENVGKVLAADNELMKDVFPKDKPQSEFKNSSDKEITNLDRVKYLEKKQKTVYRGED